jgi:hypothetical protein
MSTTLSMSTPGSERVNFAMLAEIPLPEPTATYQPVPHTDLVNLIRNVSGDILHGYEFHNEQYGLARDGKQMFGIHTYRSDSDEIGLSLGFRNSYDKSMAIGLVIGASVFICDNMVFAGEITTFRKHTANVLNDLTQLILSTVYARKSNYAILKGDISRLKQQRLQDDEAYRMLGYLYGKNILTPRQLPVVRKEWESPTYDAFSDRNLWSFYNAVTEGLKTSPPSAILEKHIQLHNLLAA